MTEHVNPLLNEDYAPPPKEHRSHHKNNKTLMLEDLSDAVDAVAKVVRIADKITPNMSLLQDMEHFNTHPINSSNDHDTSIHGDKNKQEDTPKTSSSSSTSSETTGSPINHSNAANADKPSDSAAANPSTSGPTVRHDAPDNHTVVEQPVITLQQMDKPEQHPTNKTVHETPESRTGDTVTNSTNILPPEESLSFSQVKPKNMSASTRESGDKTKEIGGPTPEEIWGGGKPKNVSVVPSDQQSSGSSSEQKPKQSALENMLKQMIKPCAGESCPNTDSDGMVSSFVDKLISEKIRKFLSNEDIHKLPENSFAGSNGSSSTANQTYVAVPEKVLQQLIGKNSYYLVVCSRVHTLG